MPTPAGDRPRLRRRPSGEALALWAVSALVLATCLAQAPGRVVPETKLDVTLDPVRYLGRALSAWDPSAGFGRVQNQAVGYLFPMGAFSSVGDLLGVPAWITQRAWIALVLLAGLWGAHRLARALGVATAPGRVVAACAYALAPATVATTAFQSAGQLPYALAPWVLLPLVSATPGRGPRRAAAASALAVVAMGGVNGTSALAVLPLAVVWFLTRSPGPERRRLAAWWVGGVLAATLWWALALAVSVRYGVRFTALTEQSAITTSTESATEVWRGTGNWLPHLLTAGNRWLPGGWALDSHPAAVVGSVAVAAGGAAGLARRDAPGRTWLLPAAVLGAIALGAGYVGPGGGSLAEPVRTLLDGPLAAFRNVHKFSAVVRLPLAIGLGHLVSVLGRRPAPVDAPVVPDDDPEPAGLDRAPAVVARARSAAPVLAPALAAVAVLLAVLPAAAGHLTAPGSFADVPAAWRDAARWIDTRPGHHRTLLLPGSGFGEYRWGRPLDEPFGVITEGDWAVRDLIPLGGNGSTRWLDALDSALLDDHLPAGFTSSLQRAGVGHLVVRNDLDLDRTGGPRPATVRRLLATDPDLRRVASFGPVVRLDQSDERLGPRPGDDEHLRIRQVEVYAVPRPTARAVAYPADGALVVGGGPEALAQLPADLVDGRATFVGDDAPADGAEAGALRTIAVATDTARRRDVIFGGLRNNVTRTLAADEASPITGEDPVDRWPGDEPPPLTVARLHGAAELTDDTPEGVLVRPELQPWSAFDGDPATTWSAPARTDPHRTLVVRFDGPRRVPEVRVRVPAPIGQRVATVEVTTDGGTRTLRVGPDGTGTVATAPGTTRSVRLRIATIISGEPVAAVGLSEVSLGGVALSRPLAVPAPARGDGADVASFQRATRDRYDLVRRDEDAIIDREVDLAAGPWAFSGTASSVPDPSPQTISPPTPGVDGALVVSASSSLHGLGSSTAARAFDGDPGTAWVSDLQLTSPDLHVSWDGPVEVSELRIRSLSTGTDPVRRVVVIVGDRRLERSLPASGLVRIPAVRTAELSLAFPSRSGAARRVGIAEVTIPALDGRRARVPDPRKAVHLACGDGPELRLDGRRIPTRLDTTIGALLDGRPARWRACEPVAATAGRHRVRGPVDGTFRIDTVLAEPEAGIADAPSPRPTRVEGWGRTVRRVGVAEGRAAVLTTTENHNDGWTAELDGRSLTAVRVDGWRQGFLVPAGAGGTITLRFAPDRSQQTGLAIGGLGVALLVGAVLVPRRRAKAWDPPGERDLPDPLLIGLAALVGVLVGGPMVVLLLPLLVLPHRERRLPWVAACAIAVAGVAVLTDPGANAASGHGSFSLVAQVVAVLAWLALAASAVSPAWPARRRD
jgi:arabinofuranan 3-O-arabinosyltransferase